MRHSYKLSRVEHWAFSSPLPDSESENIMFWVTSCSLEATLCCKARSLGLWASVLRAHGREHWIELSRGGVVAQHAPHSPLQTTAAKGWKTVLEKLDNLKTWLRHPTVYSFWVSFCFLSFFAVRKSDLSHRMFLLSRMEVCQHPVIRE